MSKQITILCFASLQEMIGKHELSFQIIQETKISELREQLSDLYPQAKQLIANCMIAVNQRYEKDQSVVKANDVVALIPPVSGG